MHSFTSMCACICVYIYIHISPGLFWPELRQLAFGPLHLAERGTKSELAERDGYVLVLCGTDLTTSTVWTAARAVTWSDFSKLTCNSKALRKPCVSWGMSCWLSQCIISLLALRSLQPCVTAWDYFYWVYVSLLQFLGRAPWGRRRLRWGQLLLPIGAAQHQARGGEMLVGLGKEKGKKGK